MTAAFAIPDDDYTDAAAEYVDQAFLDEIASTPTEDSRTFDLDWGDDHQHWWEQMHHVGPDGRHYCPTGFDICVCGHVRRVDFDSQTCGVPVLEPYDGDVEVW